MIENACSSRYFYECTGHIVCWVHFLCLERRYYEIIKRNGGYCAKPYQEENAEEIVRLIIRNFREVNVKDYGEKAMDTSSFGGSPTESMLLTIFVLPEFHGQGIGSYIIDTLETDELFLRAERIEIPASITAAEFYRKKGYDYKDGIKKLDDEQHYRMEKFPGKR